MYFLSIFHAEFLPLVFRKIGNIELAKTMALRHSTSSGDLWVIQDGISCRVLEFGFVRDLVNELQKEPQND